MAGAGSSTHRDADRTVESTLKAAATVAGGITVGIVAFLLVGSLPALRAVGPLRFLTDPSWNPAHGAYNVVPMLVGTWVVTAGAVLLATPLAVASAVFGRFYVRGALSRAHRRILETLAGIPSVVYGLWGLMVLVPAIARIGPPGQSVLAGVLVLALMILPTIALVGDAALGAVPETHLRGAAAAGLSRWAIVRSIALPAARSGILTGILLGTGRALGETMAVVMVTGNVVQLPGSVLAPVRTLTANIALEMAYATDAHRSALFVSGLVLALLTIGLVAAVDRIAARHGETGTPAYVV
jgi:phosphate transport system permease protein